MRLPCFLAPIDLPIQNSQGLLDQADFGNLSHLPPLGLGRPRQSELSAMLPSLTWLHDKMFTVPGVAQVLHLWWPGASESAQPPPLCAGRSRANRQRRWATGLASKPDPEIAHGRRCPRDSDSIWFLLFLFLFHEQQPSFIRDRR